MTTHAEPSRAATRLPEEDRDDRHRPDHPFGDHADLSDHRPRPADEVIPDMGDFQMEQMLLGLAAYRAGRKLEYDGTTGRVTNDEAANALLRRTYREGWALDAQVAL